MKKGLSVLLIVAALFGFYGGASSLTDVLACKDYWEKEGEKSTADMNKLEDGLNQLGDNEEAYLDGVKQVADGEVALEEGKQTLAQGEADYAAAPAKLRKGEADLAAGKAAYKEGKATYEAGKKTYNDGKKALEELTKNVDLLSSKFNQWSDKYENKLVPLIKAGKKDAYGNDFSSYFKDDNAAATASDVQTAAAPFMTYYEPAKAAGVAPAIEKDYSNLETVVKMTAGYYQEGDAKGAAAEAQKLIDGYNSSVPAEKKIDSKVVLGETGYSVSPAIPSDSGFDTLRAGVKAYVDAANKALGEAGLAAKTGSNFATVALIYGLADGEKQLQDNIKKLFNALGEDNMKEMGSKAEIQKLQTLLFSAGDAGFNQGGKILEKKAYELIKAKNAELAQGKAKLNAAEKELAAGAKKIKAGEAKLAQGYADYEAAPAKLAAGRQQLADGLKQLEEGKKQLAQYEDGEQQVRDGLATLMSTEPNGGLESILDRRGGDDEFDDANGHLDIQEGLDAVDVGRGYQADSGELITKEITNRAVGTAAGLGAAVLACLAALLSLIKKYKGAAVTAVLAAIAGVAGAVVGNGAGSEFSNIAGSTVGSLPWIAAGVVAAVACVFAIVNFTAKAE
jgi:uncharacterized phage infection (PIP) family protein YhgE